MKKPLTRMGGAFGRINLVGKSPGGDYLTRPSDEKLTFPSPVYNSKLLAVTWDASYTGKSPFASISLSPIIALCFASKRLVASRDCGEYSVLAIVLTRNRL